MKLCKDCKHFIRNTSEWVSDKYQTQYGFCLKGGIQKVCGSPIVRAKRARYMWPIGFCGPSAKYWEPK